MEDIKKSPPKSPRIKDHSPKVKIKMEYSPPKESSPKTAKASPAKSKSQTVKKDGKLVDVKKEKNVKATQMKASPKGKVSAKVSPNLKGPKSPKGTKTLKDKKLKNGTAPAAKKTLKTTKKNKNSARAKNKMIVKLPSCSPRKKAAVIEKVPVKVKTPVKDKTPVKEKTPVKSPVKEKSPVKNNTPLKDTTLVKEKIPVKDTTPVKEKLPVKDKNPVKDTTPVKDKTAVKDKIAVKDKTTMKDKTLVKGPLKDKPSIKDKTSAKESGSASNKKSSVNVKIKPGVKRKILSDDSDKGNNSHVPAKKTKQTGDKKILPRKKCVKGKRKKKKNTPEEYKSLHNIGSRSATEKVVSYCESTIELKASFEQRMELEHSLEASLKRKMALKNARSPTLLSGKKSEVKDVKNRDDDKEKDSDSKKCQRLKGTAAKECDKKPCKKEPVKMKNGEDPNEDKEKVGSKRKLGKESVGRPKKKKGKIVKNTKKNVQSVFNSFCMLRKKSGEPLSKRYQHLQPRPFRFRREASLNATCMMNMMYEKEEHHLAKVVKVEELTEVKDKVTEEKQNDTSSKGPEKKTNSDKKQSPKKVSPAKSAKGKEKKPVPKVKGKVNSEKVDKKNDKNVKFPKTKLGLKKKKKVGGGEGKEIEIVSGKVKKAAKLAATANWMLPRRVASLNAEAILAASREPRKKSISRKRAARTDADVFPAHAVKEKEKGEEYMGKIVAHWVEGWGTDFLKLKPTQHWVTADMVEHVNVTDVPEPLRVPFVPKEEMVSPPPPSAGTSPVRSPLPHMTQRAAPNLTMPSPMMVNNILPSGPLQGPGPQGQMYAHHQAFLRPPTGGRHMAAERQRGQEQFSQIPSHGQYRPQHNQGQPMGGPGQGMRFPPHGGPPYMNAHGMVGRFQPPNQIQGQHGQMTNQMSHPHHMTGQYRPMTNQMPRQQHQMTNRMAGPQRQMTNQMPLNRQMPGQMQRMPMGKQLQRQQQQQGQMMTQGPGQCHMPNQMPGQQQGNTQMIAQQGQMTNQMPGPPGQFTALLLGTQGHMSGQEMMNTQIQGSMANQMHGQQNPMANQMASPQGHMTGQMIENQVQSPRPDGQMNSNVPLHSGQITSQMHSPNMQMTNQMHGQMTNQMQAHGQMANQMAPQHGQMTNQMQGQHGQMPNQMQDQQEQMANQVSSQHGQLSNQMQGQQDQMVNQMSPQHSHMTNQMTGSDGQVANQMPEQHGGPMGNQMPPQQQQQQQVPEQQNKISEPLEQGPNPNYEQKQSHCHPGHMQGHGPPAHSQHSTIPGACTYPYPHSSTPMGGTPPTSQCQNYSMGGLSSLDNLSVMYHRPFGSAFTVPAGYPNPQVSYSKYQLRLLAALLHTYIHTYILSPLVI